MKQNTAVKQNSTPIVTENVDNDVAELKNQVAMLQKLLLEQMSTKENKTENNPDDIRPDEYVELMSLIHYRLTLTTQTKGGGKAYQFNQFGEKKRILYRDLVDILETQQRFLQSGMFYILDGRVIRKHGLDDLYNTILDKNKIDKILEMEDSNQVVSLFKSGTPKQQGIVCDILVEKILRDEYIDMNIVYQLEKNSKVSILKKVEEIKRNQELEKING